MGHPEEGSVPGRQGCPGELPQVRREGAAALPGEEAPDQGIARRWSGRSVRFPRRKAGGGRALSRWRRGGDGRGLVADVSPQCPPDGFREAFDDGVRRRARPPAQRAAHS